MKAFNNLQELSDFLGEQIEKLKALDFNDMKNYTIDHYEVSEKTGTLWAVCFRESGGVTIWKDFEIK